MEFQTIIDRAIGIREQYEKKEKLLYGSSWTSEEVAFGFVGDVGDLAKLVIAEMGNEIFPTAKKNLSTSFPIAYGLSLFLQISTMLIRKNRSPKP